MRGLGMRDGTQAGDVVQYVICRNTSPDAPSHSSSTSLAERAYHPQEVLENNALQVDTQYYLSHQLQPVVSRLCAPLDATSDARLAECLGLDGAKFRSVMPATDTLAAVR
jgi:DNA polymerase alpha subunit A